MSLPPPVEPLQSLQRTRGESIDNQPPLILPLVLLSTIAGLLVASYCPPWPLPLLWPALLAICWVLLRHTAPAPLLLAGFCALLAAAQYQHQLSPVLPVHHVAHFADGQIHTIEARIETLHGGETLRMDLEAERLIKGPQQHPLTGRLRLTLGEGQPNLRPGQRIRFSSRLRSPEIFGTPGEFHYPRYLAGRSIFATAYVARAELVVPFVGDQQRGFMQRLAGWRRHIGQRIEGTVKPDQAALVRALVIGDRNLPPELRRQLAETGLSHLFAISGLHLGLLALFLYQCGVWLYKRSECLLLLAPPGRLLPLFLLPLLWLYLQLSGNALSTQRAFIMAVIAALLLFNGRRTRPLHSLTTVALIMLCGAPLILFEPAWQLSMAGVTGILLCLPNWQKRLSRWPRWGRWPGTLAATTLAATIATAPLSLAHFHLFAPAGLLNNLLAVPLIGFGAVPLGLLGALIDPLWPTGTNVLYRLCGTLCHLTLQGAGWTQQLPWLSARTCYLSPSTLLAAAILSLLLLIPRWPDRWRHFPFALLMVALLLLFVPSRPPQELTLTALSVGHGEALLLSRPQGGHYLIDGGGFYDSSFDVGARLVAPALARLGVGSLEAVILTHDHPDHRLGLIEILNHFPVKAFWSAQPPDELHPELRQPLLQKAIPHRTFSEGWTLVDEDPSGKLALYAPSQRASKINDRSLILYAGHGQDGLLLTGDLERQGIDDLVDNPPPGTVTLLQVPHHGSRHSEPWLLVDALHPKMVFASTGRNNSYGLPHKDVTQALAKRGLNLYHTGQDKSLRFDSAGSGWTLQRWQKGLFR